MEKLVGYCLNPEHRIGGPKARVFRAALGLTAEDAPKLRAAILNAAVTCEAIEREPTPYGRRYVVDFEMSGPAGSATVRTAWQIAEPGAAPYLITCMVK